MFSIWSLWRVLLLLTGRATRGRAAPPPARRLRTRHPCRGQQVICRCWPEQGAAPLSADATPSTSARPPGRRCDEGSPVLAQTGVESPRRCVLSVPGQPFPSACSSGSPKSRSGTPCAPTASRMAGTRQKRGRSAAATRSRCAGGQTLSGASAARADEVAASGRRTAPRGLGPPTTHVQRTGLRRRRRAAAAARPFGAVATASFLPRTALWPPAAGVRAGPAAVDNRT